MVMTGSACNQPAFILIQVKFYVKSLVFITTHLCIELTVDVFADMVLQIKFESNAVFLEHQVPGEKASLCCFHKLNPQHHKSGIDSRGLFLESPEKISGS